MSIEGSIQPLIKSLIVIHQYWNQSEVYWVGGNRGATQFIVKESWIICLLIMFTGQLCDAKTLVRSRLLKVIINSSSSPDK